MKIQTAIQLILAVCSLIFGLRWSSTNPNLHRRSPDLMPTYRIQPTEQKDSVTNQSNHPTEEVVQSHSEKFQYNLSTTVSLSNLWEAEKVNPIRQISDRTIQLMRNEYTLFVPGYLNELSKDQTHFFQSNIRTVTDVFGGNASYFAPPSNIDAVKNAESIHVEIQRIHEKFHRPLVLIGYSKGGLELLYLVLMHPELVLNGIVSTIVLIQSPVLGTPLALTDQMSSGFRWLTSFLGPGFESLNPVQATARLKQLHQKLRQQMLQNFQDLKQEQISEKIQEISNRIFYVTSFEHPHKLHKKLRQIHSFLGHDLSEYGISDGIVPTSFQSTDLIGHALKPIQADHLTFVGSFPPYEKEDENEQAFLRALLQLIHDTIWNLPLAFRIEICLNLLTV